MNGLPKVPVVTGLVPQVVEGDVAMFGFKKESQVPFSSSILKPVVVNGSKGTEVRWQPRETGDERKQRISAAINNSEKNKNKKLVAKWKKQGKIRTIDSYFSK